MAGSIGGFPAAVGVEARLHLHQHPLPRWLALKDRLHGRARIDCLPTGSQRRDCSLSTRSSYFFVPLVI